MPPKSRRKAATPDRLILHVDPGTRADLAMLCADRAARDGSNPDRLAAPIVRELIRSAARALRDARP